MNKKPFYITTTLPYVNADPHVGFAMEILRADVLARYKQLMGHEVFFNTGTDEHGIKIWNKAKEEGHDVKDYIDIYAEKFKNLGSTLGLSSDIHFIRTTDPHHIAAAQEFWKRVNDNGYIYKKNYQVKYCIGCELEKTDSELNDDGRCPIHPNMPIENIDEENYFFKFSDFGEKLLTLYEEHPDFVLPESRFNEIKAFVGRGLQDFSISRLASKMPWGVPVPGDEDQVMYVWFDALVNYISTLGWPDESGDFKKYWIDGQIVQIAGKDNLRQQSAMWQAMLIAAGVPTSQHILINGFVNIGGQKMSKSLGNVINPFDLVEQYGTEAIRTFLLKELIQWEDADMTLERFRDAYNADLANGLGNLTSRIMKMAESNLDAPVSGIDGTFPQELADLLDHYEIQKSMQYIWQKIAETDKMIQETEPFKVVKTDHEKGVQLITELVKRLASVAVMLTPFLPETSSKILELIKKNKAPETPLFLRKE